MIDSDDDTVYTVTSIVATDININKAPTVGSINLTLSKSYQPFDVVNMTGTGSITGTNHIVLSEADAALVTVGDILCPQGYCAFPKVPVELRSLLAQSAVVAAMMSMKDKDGYKIAKENLGIFRRSLYLGLISPRIENEVKKIVNTSSPLWGKRSRRH